MAYAASSATGWKISFSEYIRNKGGELQWVERTVVIDDSRREAAEWQQNRMVELGDGKVRAGKITPNTGGL